MTYEYNDYCDRVKINGVIYEPHEHVIHWEDVEMGEEFITIYTDFAEEWVIRMTQRRSEEGCCVKLEKYRYDAEDEDFDINNPNINNVEILPNPESMIMESDFDIDEGRPEPYNPFAAENDD